MGAEIKFNKELEFDPEELEGRDFRVSTIKWDGDQYTLHGLHLPFDWENKMAKLDEYNCDQICKIALGKVPNLEVEVDNRTGLITQIILDKNKNSRVYLETRMGRSGIYTGEGLIDLAEVVKYQKLLAYYLDIVTGWSDSYAYIDNRGYNESGSINLTIPKRFFDSKEPVTDEWYQSGFEKIAWKVSGMFGTDVRYCRFDSMGFLDIVQINANDCHYSLDRSSRTYNSHNVDSVYGAATLHGIVAEFINDLLKRESQGK